MRNAKVCIITTVHMLFDTRIFMKEAQSLVQAGLNVALIARHEKSEKIDGIKVVGFRGSCNRFYRMFFSTWKAFFLSIKEGANIYHFHDPELIVCGIGLKIFTKAKVIYDVHEDVPKEILGKEWLPNFLRKWIAHGVKWVEIFAARFLDAMVVATPSIAKRFPPSKTTIVQNFPKADERSEKRNYLERSKGIVYVGDIRVVRGAHEMVNAIELLRDVDDANLFMVGRFTPPSLKDVLERHPGWKRVRFLGWQGENHVKEILKDSRIGLLIFHPLPNHIEAQPNKLFEYMAAGLPVVASDFPLWRKIISEGPCGLLVNPLDTQMIADAIKYLLDNPREAEEMGKRGRDMVLRKYRWEHEEKKLLSLYRGLLKN